MDDIDQSFNLVARWKGESVTGLPAESALTACIVLGREVERLRAAFERANDTINGLVGKLSEANADRERKEEALRVFLNWLHPESMEEGHPALALCEQAERAISTAPSSYLDQVKQEAKAEAFEEAAKWSYGEAFHEGIGTDEAGGYWIYGVRHVEKWLRERAAALREKK